MNKALYYYDKYLLDMADLSIIGTSICQEETRNEFSYLDNVAILRTGAELTLSEIDDDEEETQGVISIHELIRARFSGEEEEDVLLLDEIPNSQRVIYRIALCPQSIGDRLNLEEHIGFIDEYITI